MRKSRASKVCQPVVAVRLRRAKTSVEISEGIETRLGLIASSIADKHALSRGVGALEADAEDGEPRGGPMGVYPEYCGYSNALGNEKGAAG